MLGITIQFKISVRRTPKVTTVICHHMKKKIIKKIQKYEKLYTIRK